MNADGKPFPPQAGKRWWRPEPGVRAQLRAPAGQRRQAWADTSAFAVHGGRPIGDVSRAFAATVWPETEWADTRSEPAL